MSMFQNDAFDWQVAFGHLHPLILHLPIGLFVGLAFLLLVGGDREKPGLRRAHGALVFLLATATPLAAATGWLLHERGSYGEPVDLHEWLGIGLAALSVVIGIAFVSRAKLYAPLVWLGVLVLFPTGHFGAVLTHGEEFLLDAWFPPEETASHVEESSAEATPAGEAASRVDFALVQPVLDRACGRCHGESKQRGGLALNTLEGARTGGDSGPALVFGDPDGSLLLNRLQLPLETAGHMPPAGKPQPSAEELELLRAWIAEEAVSIEAPTPAEEAEEETGAAEAPPATAPPAAVPPAEGARAVAALRERLVHVQALAENTDELWVDFASATLGPGELEALLGPLGPNIVELSLARQDLAPEDLACVGSLPRLERLDLRALPAGPRSLAGLGGAPELRVLNLAGTAVEPSAQEVLVALPRLERMYVWETGLDPEALRASRSDLEIHAASPAPDEAVELEDVVVFSRVGEEPPDAAAIAATSPVNTTCPVTGSPVDARYVILFEGSAIGFCCPNCPKTFWQDPDPFLAELGLANQPEND